MKAKLADKQTDRQTNSRRIVVAFKCQIRPKKRKPNGNWENGEWVGGRKHRKTGANKSNLSGDKIKVKCLPRGLCSRKRNLGRKRQNLIWRMDVSEKS